MTEGVAPITSFGRVPGRFRVEVNWRFKASRIGGGLKKIGRVGPKIGVLNNGRGDENNEVILVQAFGFAAEGISQIRYVAQDWNLGGRRYRTVVDQAAHDESISVRDEHLSFNLSGIKQRR